MHTVYSIAEILGRRKMARRLKVGLTAVGNAVSDGVFPASYYGIVKKMLEEKGIEVPVRELEALFAFKADPMAVVENSAETRLFEECEHNAPVETLKEAS